MLRSISENRGIAALHDTDLHVYSVGISTGGIAEMRMAELHPRRTIIATTIDQQGAASVKKHLEEKGLSQQVIVTLEDVAHHLPYESQTFDFIYARLVLHYLAKNDLDRALTELYRVLKVGGRLFVVVRSTACDEAQSQQAVYDPISCLTTYTSGSLSYSRYFHTEDSIRRHLVSSGFSIDSINSYKEQLCVDFQRTQVSTHIDSLIEILGSK